MEEQDEHEKYEEIDREMIDKMTDYMDHEIKSGQGKDGEFFQIMEDVVSYVKLGVDIYKK